MDNTNMIKMPIMFYKRFLVLIVALTLTMSAIGCGVSKSDHEKIVKELEKANQEKAALSDQINQLKAENESVAQNVSKIESDLNALQQENEDLKTKLAAASKRVAKPAKPAVQPKTTKPNNKKK